MADHSKTARAFVERTGPATQGNMTATSHEVWSYKELIAQAIGPDSVEVNTKKYSKTTSSHQSAIVRALLDDGWYEAEQQNREGWTHYTRI